MGDRLATIDMDRKVGRGRCVPLFLGELGPHLTQCGMGRGLPSYHVASSFIQSFGTTDMGRKLGVCAPLGEVGPHLT